MIRPAIGQSILTNLVATLRLHGNAPANLNLARIAKYQPAEVTEGDLIAEFDRQERAEREMTIPNNNFEESGK